MEHIKVIENVLSANDKIAQENKNLLTAAGVYSLNIMASPGAGKTSLIEETIKDLTPDYQIAVIEGDLATSIDAERVEALGAQAIQINTGGGCHLEAVMLQSALSQLFLEVIDLLIVENVGNLICPSNWQLGTDHNLLVASIPEGDDKPYKYPGMYRGVDALVINKIDLMPYISFDMDYFRKGVEILNPGVKVFPLSCQTGEGLSTWSTWLREQIAAVQSMRVNESVR